MVQVSLDMTIVATTIPKITDDFHSQDFVAWIGSAFFLTVAAFQSSKLLPFPRYQHQLTLPSLGQGFQILRPQDDLSHLCFYLRTG